MTDQTILAYLKQRVSEYGPLDAPVIGTIRPEIRSGDKFLLRDPFAGSAGKTAGVKAKDRLDRDAVGAIIVEWGYDVAPENLTAFKAFLDANEGSMLDARPKGVRYRGTYAVFSSTEKGTGHFRTIWAYRHFGDLDALSDQYEDGTPFSSQIKQLRSFADPNPLVGRSQNIYLLASSAQLTDR